MDKDMEKIMSGMECAKNFICCKPGSHNLCHAKDIGMASFLECLERNPKKCRFCFPFGLSYLCECPLRVYIEKNLNK